MKKLMCEIDVSRCRKIGQGVEFRGGRIDLIVAVLVPNNWSRGREEKSREYKRTGGLPDPRC